MGKTTKSTWKYSSVLKSNKVDRFLFSSRDQSNWTLIVKEIELEREFLRRGPFQHSTGFPLRSPQL